jgi:hypothetical protein
VTKIQQYRLSPDEMTESAGRLGCQFLVPHTNRDYRLESSQRPAVIVTNNSTDADWWQELATQSSAVCFIHGRLRWEPKWRNGNLQGQTAFYVGNNPGAFAAEFGRFGVVRPRPPQKVRP